MARPCKFFSFAGRLLLILTGLMATAFLGLFLLCAGLGCLIYWGAERALSGVTEGIADAQRQAELDAARAALSAFLDDLRSDNAIQAYDRASKGFQTRQTLSEWENVLRGHPELKNMHGTDLEVKSTGSTDPMTCHAILTGRDGVDVGGVLELVKANGRWEVDRLIIR